MKSFADKIVALAATIGREREIAIRKLCDDVDRRIKKLEEANKNIAYHLNEVMQLVRMNTGEESSTRKGDVTTAREGTVTTTTVHERDGSDYSSPDPIPAWMPSAHELRNAHANRNYAFHADASDYEPFERIRRLIASRSPSKLPTPEDVAAPIRAALEASRSPSHELVEAADALRNEMTMPSDGSFAPFVDRSLKDKIEAYDAARSRHASGAQPDSACDESGWLVEITGPKYWTGTPGCGNWTADSLAAMRFARRQDAEAACRHLAPSGAIPVEHAWVSHRPAGAQPSGAPALASAQGEVCECGHGRAMHFDEDGDHNGPCLWQVHKDAPFCKCDMWHRKPSEDEFLGVPVSEWRQIAAEINCRRGPDGSLLKRFRELLEVSDLRAALLKKRSAPSPSPALLSALLMASDAMRYVAVRGVAFHGDKETIEAYDRARAALPKGGAA